MPSAEPRNSVRSLLALLAGVLGFVVSLFCFAAIGEGGPIGARIAIVLAETLYSGWIPVVYMLGAFGYGSLLAQIICKRSLHPALSMGLGLAVMLMITHALGIIGIFNTTSAWTSSGIGIVLAVLALRNAKPTIHLEKNPATLVLLAILGAAIASYCVAAASPPGALWDSEFGVYDSLSYHLQLPKEWIHDGRIWPSEHNVYSFHPGFIEASFAHLALLARESAPMQSTHFLSMMLVMTAAWNAAAATSRMCAYTDDSKDASSVAGLLAAAMILLTPWVIVIGTISYNEGGVIALASAALFVVSDDRFTPAQRGMLSGILVGGACGCKMTAIFFVAPSIGILLLASSQKSDWWKIIFPGAIAGITMLLPWMIRNTIASGNPVFPHADAIFGEGHWTSEQLARFASAHTFDGTLLDRIRLLVLPDTSAPIAIHVARFRGLTNMQWGMLPLLTLISLILLLARRSTHKLGFAMLLACVLPMIAWVTMTHLQSRFFVPMVPLCVCIVGIAVAHLPSSIAIRRCAAALSAGALFWVLVVFGSQRLGNPNILLTIGSFINTDAIETQDGLQALTWTAVLNETVDPIDTVYLIGDAAVFYLRPQTIVSTTYDTPAIAPLIDQHPDDPTQWIIGLREMSVDWIVINTSELDRLGHSGWLDPRLSPERITQLADTLESVPTLNLDPVRSAYRITDFPAP